MIMLPLEAQCYMLSATMVVLDYVSLPLLLLLIIIHHGVSIQVLRIVEECSGNQKL